MSGFGAHELVDALVSLDATLSGCTTPTAVLRAALAHLPALLPCAPSAVAAIDDETLLPSVLASHGGGEAAPALLDDAVERGLFALALRRGQPVLDERADGSVLVIQALATSGHIAGVLLGIVASVAEPERLAALAVVGSRVGAAHENLVLRAQIEADKDELERRVAERTADLATALDRAEAASRAKSAFLATMSHELRTPLNGIIGMTDLLLPEETVPLRRDRLAVVHGCAEDLLSHIDGVLDLSRIEADRLVLSPAEADPLAVAQEALRTVAPRAQAKGLALSLVPAADLPGRLVLDAGRWRQVLLNLLGNAVKFTERGAVILELAARADADAWVLSAAVSDTGPGIPPEVQARLFTPFEQGDASISRRYGGTGLGLIISKRLCELMGGELVLASTPGNGATFTARARCAAAAGNPAPVAPDGMLAKDPPLAAGIAGMRVLAADDQEVNRLVLAGMLRRLGIEAVLAEGGAHAIELARAGGWDVVLLDCQMPEVDGFAAAARIRADGCPARIVAVTAHAMAGDREECLRRGFDDYLPKPVRPPELAALLARCRDGAEPAPAEAGPARLAQLIDEVGAETVAAIATAMLEEAPRLLAEATAALAAGDLPGLVRRAHTLKGDAANIGLDQLSALAKELEHAAKAGDLATCRARTELLPAAWERAAAALRAVNPG